MLANGNGLVSTDIDRLLPDAEIVLGVQMRRTGATLHSLVQDAA